VEQGYNLRIPVKKKEVAMRTTNALCILVIGLTLPAVAQRKPTAEQPIQRLPEQRRPQLQEPEQSKAAEQNKAVVRQVFDDLFTRGRYEMVGKVYSSDCIVHHNNRQYRLEESVAEGKGWRSAAPDLQMVPEGMTTQGNMVTVAWIARGTHTGKGNGLVKPTGKHILVRGSSTFRVVNGKIVEVWNNFDRNEIFRQLGVSPTMAFLYDETEGLRLAFNRMLAGPPAPPQQ
jgi:predicted ester cyclase